MQKILNDLEPSPTATETSLGARVRQIRKTRKWTLKELSDRTGLAISTISKMERGEISLTYDRFMRLAQGLGLDVVQRIVQRHGGSVKVNSKPGRTEFEVCLPLNIEQ